MVTFGSSTGGNVTMLMNGIEQATAIEDTSETLEVSFSTGLVHRS